MNVNYFPSFLQILSGLVVSIAYWVFKVVSSNLAVYVNHFFLI